MNLNSKSLFTILFYNSDYFLQYVLIKQQSKYHSIPFYYPLPKLSRDSKFEDISFQVNMMAAYFLKQNYISIASFGLTKARLGKTELIN